MGFFKQIHNITMTINPDERSCTEHHLDSHFITNDHIIVCHS